MRKFKCLGCISKSCYVEQEDDILAPCCCVHGWNGDTEWKEVEEQENTKKEVKGIVRNIPKWITEDIVNEYSWACYKHPDFPSNEFEMMCIIQEYSGKAVQALNDLKFRQQGKNIDVYAELLCTIATCIRTLEEMDKNQLKLERD